MQSRGLRTSLSTWGSLPTMNVTELFGLVVASMGRFSRYRRQAGLEIRHAPGQGDYLSVVLEDGIPIGCLSRRRRGRHTAVLGMLRPYIRQHKYLGMERPDDLLQALQLRLFP